ncbi:Lsr2 family protein [Micromonospora sp. CPCC 205371]|nr:Lsr2 family protein [Micromonospora sp. CPCC 205371]
MFTEVLTDDLDASVKDVATVSFCLDGVAYEIDVTPANRERLKAALVPFIRAGRRLPKARNPHRSAKGRASATTGEATAAPADEAIVRAWWRQRRQNDNLPSWRSSGPIPLRVTKAFRAAQQAAQEHNGPAVDQQPPAGPSSSLRAAPAAPVVFTPPRHP